jgi:hypothetical protein
VTPILTLGCSLEEFIDVIAEILLSPELARILSLEHERQRVKIPIRLPEVVYTEDVETPDGYPCCEVLAIRVADEANSTAQELQHEISLQWTVNGDNEQLMGREIKRLISASRDTFRMNSLLPQIGGSVWPGDADFGPTTLARANVVGLGVSGRFVKSASLALFWKAFAR